MLISAYSLGPLVGPLRKGLDCGGQTAVLLGTPHHCPSGPPLNDQLLSGTEAPGLQGGGMWERAGTEGSGSSSLQGRSQALSCQRHVLGCWPTVLCAGSGKTSELI